MNQEGVNYRFIITGGPGSGKTTLVKALEKRGFDVFPEIARKLMGSGVEAPINNPGTARGNHFGSKVLQKRIDYYVQANPNTISFYDRGIPDSLGFLKFMIFQNL